MDENKIMNDDIAVYIEDQEYIANKYVMRCFAVTMLIYTITFILNIVGIFIIDKKVMCMGFFPSVIIYLLVFFASKKISLSNRKTKYFILFNVILVFTIMGVSITYHVVLGAILPFLYATLYSSKRIMKYVYAITVVSTVVIVYGGYYFGLCDANMALLTSTTLQNYVSDGKFILTEVNSNPAFSLMLFYIIPRCLIYTAFVFVCRSIVNIVSGSLERAKLTGELKKAKEEAESANRAKSQFLARVSHEIRTPINAVMGMNEMILRETSEEDIRKYAGDIKDSSVMLLNIINEILDSSKIESGMMEIVPVNYEISSLLNDLYNMINIKAREKGLNLVFDIDSSIPCEYIGDDKRIRQILLNLLSNAVKYTEKGTITLKVEYRPAGENAILYYTVKDTGIGIKEEDIGRIYDAFRRFDLAKNKDIEGTGLGMNIARQFLKLMDSELTIKSEYGKGSEFSFALMQKIVNSEPIGDFRGRIDQAAEEVYRPVYIAPEARVLVVDDYEMNLKVFRGLLKQTQIQVFEAESGWSCLDMVKQHPFDLIFLDHMMPGIDGIETLQAMRKDKLCEGVPVIMLTANAIVGDRERYISEGFDDFLSKPIIPDKLDKLILKYLPAKCVVTENRSEDIQNDKVEVAMKKEKASSDILDELRKRMPEIRFETGLATSSGDEEFYLELFRDFVELPIKEQLNKYMTEGDYKNYCIRIHGFKNGAYSVGAMKIGDLAYEMEKLSKESLPKELNEVQNRLFEQYDRICQQYKEVVER